MTTLTELDRLIHCEVSLTSVLRRAVALFSTLHDETTLEWVKSELNGYEYERWKDRTDFPNYRRLRGYLRVKDVFGHVYPLQVPKTIEESVCFPWIVDPITVIESNVSEAKAAGGGVIFYSLNLEHSALLRKGLRRGNRPGNSEPILEYPTDLFIGIIESVRNRLLDRVVTLQMRFPNFDNDLKLGKLDLTRMETQERFFPPHSQWDAYVEIKKIITTAKNELVVIDPYVDGSFFQILAACSHSLQVKILSFKIPPDLSLEAKKFLMQHPNFALEIKTAKAFHDRFITIDGTQCYHVGASIKDAGNKAFMISQIEDKANLDALLRQQASIWTSATTVAI